MINIKYKILLWLIGCLESIPGSLRDQEIKTIKSILLCWSTRDKERKEEVIKEVWPRIKKMIIDPQHAGRHEKYKKINYDQ